MRDHLEFTIYAVATLLVGTGAMIYIAFYTAEHHGSKALTQGCQCLDAKFPSELALDRPVEFPAPTLDRQEIPALIDISSTLTPAKLDTSAPMAFFLDEQESGAVAKYDESPEYDAALGVRPRVDRVSTVGDGRHRKAVMAMRPRRPSIVRQDSLVLASTERGTQGKQSDALRFLAVQGASPLAIIRTLFGDSRRLEQSTYLCRNEKAPACRNAHALKLASN